MRTRGLCNTHYMKWWRSAKQEELHPRAKNGEALEFVKQVAAMEPTGQCVDWPYATSNGYPGISRLEVDSGYATHLVLELTGRPKPDLGETAMALHSCDRQICVAPWHLRWGTNSDNITDVFEHRNPKETE